MKVSVIMASFLGEYNGTKNRDQKFIRAVNSFLNQTYKNTELIIVSDGCPITNQICEQRYINEPNFKLVKMEKQNIFSGNVRNAGLENVDPNSQLITYLDSDDVIGKAHIETIVNQFDTKEFDMVYYNDFLTLTHDFKQLQRRDVQPRWASIGTSSISHINSPEVQGCWCDGYGHDFLFFLRLVSKGFRFKKLDIDPKYIVCHYGNGDF